MEFDDILFECLERMELEGVAVLEALCEKHPAHASLLRERIWLLRDVGLVSNDGDPEAAEHPETLGEFRLLKKLGEGGMGAVYQAEQAGMNRRVALKLVRPAELMFSGTRERFRREVEAISRLNHPAIATVHTVGEASGIPYFAMELVEGESLDRILRHLRGQDPASLTAAHFARAIDALYKASDGDDSPRAGADFSADVFAGSWSRACVRIVRDVSTALAHAHERNVLHRDLKPSNVMLTPSGSVKLLDFGLASMADATRLTRSGALLGSLPYMAPELFEERAADQSSDVYGLGVLLYELLTLALPFAATTRVAVLQSKILDGRPDRPIKRNKSISADIETVCLTAMARDAKQRYQTAEDLSRDLDNLLANRPIEAKRASLQAQLWRWMQRQPAMAALIFMTAIGVLTIIGMQMSHTTSLDRQRELVHDSLDSAIDAVVVMVDEVVQNDLSEIPKMDAVRRTILLEAEEQFRDLVKQIVNPTQNRASWIRVHQQLGRTLLALGDPVDAFQVLEYSRAGLLEGLEVSSEDSAARWSLVAVESWMAEALFRIGQDERAIEFLLAIESKAAEFLLEGSGQAVADWLTVRRNLIGALSRRGRIDEALAIIAEVSPVLAELGERGDVTVPTFIAATMLTHSMAVAYVVLEDWEKASDLLNQVLDNFERIFARDVVKLSCRVDLAQVCLTRASMEEFTLGIEQALSRLLPYFDLIGPLHEEFPADGETVRAWAALTDRRAHFETIAGSVNVAHELFTSALSALRGVPDPDYLTLEMIGTVGNNLAELLIRTDDLLAARKVLENSLQAFQLAAEVSGKTDEFRRGRRQSLLTYCEVLLQVGDWKRAIEVSRPLEDIAEDDAALSLLLCELSSRSAALARKTAESGTEEVMEMAQTLLDHALEWLEQSLKLGYSDWSTIENSPDLSEVRSHADYQLVMQAIRAEQGR
ncbi:MAG: serine/threonine protein kinase [Planctomycetota bacterium]|jgi:serine/threonine protein kinase